MTLDEFFDKYPQGSIILLRYTDMNGIKLWRAGIDTDLESDPLMHADAMKPVTALNRLKDKLAKWGPETQS